MEVSSMGQTVSSNSRGSIPHQMPPDHCPLLTTPARGCRGNRAKGSTRLACPWASTTRFVSPSFMHTQGQKGGKGSELFRRSGRLNPCHLNYSASLALKGTVSILFCFSLFSRSPSTVRAPTSLEADTLTAKAVGYVFPSYPCKSAISVLAGEDIGARFEPFMSVKWL